jgi:hypothetical protein
MSHLRFPGHDPVFAHTKPAADYNEEKEDEAVTFQERSDHRIPKEQEADVPAAEACRKQGNSLVMFRGQQAKFAA